MKRLFAFLSFSILIFSCALFVACGSTSWNTSEDLTLVNTNYGQVKGQADSDNTIVWKAVPFAKPPVGDLRWKAPEEPDKWTGTREMMEFCDICPQYVNKPGSFTEVAGVGGSEDCLYLNIWRPNSTEDKLPVYFWIHGGGNSIQLPKHTDLSGAQLANYNNIIVVSINYRLGPLGWLTHPALKTGDMLDNSGNYGTLDIIKALEWVNKNISTFGGDPGKVTVAGESAGGFNIFSLLISDLAKGLFHRAIIESGMASVVSVEKGEEYASSLICKLLVKDGKAADEASAATYLAGMSNADINAYVRSKSAEEILSVNTPSSGAMVLFPNLFTDGVVISEKGYDLFDNGSYPNKVPIIIGANKFETKLFMFMDPKFVTVIQGSATADTLELYMLVNKYLSDLWKASLDEVTRKLQANQKNVYVYRFNWGAGIAEDSVAAYPFNYALGGTHGGEIDFFFGHADNMTGMLGRFMYTAENKAGRLALSKAIMDYTGSFVRTGSPNCEENDLPTWNQWSNYYLVGPKGLILDAGLNDLKIEMSEQEYTTLGIMGELLLEPRSQEILEAMQSYSLLSL
jgi:para-nitrobenzyl esterase